MDINSVFYSSSTSSQAVKAQEVIAKYAQSEKDDDNDKTASSTGDTYTKSDSVTTSDSGIYSKENIKKTLDEMEEQRSQAMSDMISEMLSQQSNAKGLSYLNLTGNSSSLSSLTVTKSDIDDATASISDGGYWSVDSVATRIMDMATMLAGGDESKLSTLKAAVIKGFGGAMDKLGKDSLNDMPDITQQTYKEVMNRFDKWEESFNTEGAE